MSDKILGVYMLCIMCIICSIWIGYLQYELSESERNLHGKQFVACHNGCGGYWDISRFGDINCSGVGFTYYNIMRNCSDYCFNKYLKDRGETNE